MENLEFINKAEIGDYLYIIIFVVLMLVGLLEKVKKAKRQQPTPSTPPQSYDDFEDVEKGEAPPKTIEELMQRMMETIETQEEAYPEKAESLEIIPNEAESLELIPDTPYYHYNQPKLDRVLEQSEKYAFAPVLPETETGANVSLDFEFDIRQAVIVSEILNRKY